jgi:hypothetical protein
LKTYYKNDLKKAYLILEGKKAEQEDYQIIMLRENDIDGILKTDVRYVDNQSHYHYDISGKTSFKTLHERMQLTFDEMHLLVKNLLQTIHNVRKYMLDANCILLEPEYIFFDQEKFYFCYYPPYCEDTKEAFHRLTEFFVREVNYQDEQGVHFAYTMHKMTMEENYSIEEIMQTIIPQEIEIPVMDYTQRMEDSGLEDDLIEEKNDLWEPVRKLLERARKRRMGYGEHDL